MTNTTDYQKKTMAFKPRARIMLQLGDQLIKNESIALLELVKNSYDADAKIVNIIMDNIENQDSGSITIEDDGFGMDFTTVTNVWMEPGSDYKEKIYLEKIRTKLDRLPLGEKGIGRFGAHKLGYEVELVTRKKNKPEVYVHIDWTKFQDSEYLKDVPVKIIERNAEIFKGDKYGTILIIKKLRSKWTRGDVREIYRTVNSMCSPFSGPSSFMVYLCLSPL